MNLYANLELTREPFSNSPDPSFLHQTRQHAACLQELEISLRLRRGLNVITGDIGTGKTTLCRSLLRAFTEDKNADLHLLLDPHFDTSEEFLRVILGSVSRQTPAPAMGLWELKEALKQQLFRLGMVERRLVVLIIDEGQKISRENLELLRELLNFETNSSKLLQIVIFAQRELEPMLASMPNLVDRINVRKRLVPLALAETRQMIRHRLKVAASVEAMPRLRFSPLAILAIHMASGGSPRKIVRLCHMAMLEMLVRGKHRVGLKEARTAIRPDGAQRPRPRTRRALALATAVGLCLALGSLWLSLDPSGPVLGPALVGTGGSAQPALASAASPQVQTAQAQPADAAGAVAAGARTENRAEVLAPQGLTLLPESAQGQSAPAGLTLLPERDQGPDLRSPIAEHSPPRLHVAAPEPSDQFAARAALLDERNAPGLTRTVAFSMIRQ